MKKPGLKNLIRLLVRGLQSYVPGRAAEFCGLERMVESAKLIGMKNWIVADPEHLGGSPRVRDTRISVALILESLAAGMSIADIVDAYPSLSEESVRGVLSELAHQKNLQPA